MLKRTTVVLTGFLSLLASSGSVRAEHFDFDPGMGESIFQPELAAGDGQPYEWYYQNIGLEFSGSFNDGRENAQYNDDPSGNIPYVVFDGTARSPQGHCLQVVFGGPSSDSWFANPVRNLRFSFKDSTGVDRLLFHMDTEVSPYNVVRIWIKNTSTSLTWRTKIADLDGANGAWNQSATMNIWRLQKTQAQCTTETVAAFPNVTYVTIIGRTGNYNICKGELNQSTGQIEETCNQGS